MADEAGFLELLVANERIGRFLDVLCDPYQRNKCVLYCRSVDSSGSSSNSCGSSNRPLSSLSQGALTHIHSLCCWLLYGCICRHKHAINQLQQDLRRGGAYVEEVGDAVATR